MSKINQIKLYSVDTSAFYTKEEFELQNKMYEINDRYKKVINRTDKLIKKYEKENDEKYKKAKRIKSKLSSKNKDTKSELEALNLKYKGVRELRSEEIAERNVIATFPSALTRALELNPTSNEPTTDIIIVEVYSYTIMEQLINNGFMYDKQAYTYAFSGAGQIRTKKLVFINKDKYESVHDKLFAGLTDKMISDTEFEKTGENGEVIKSKGISINKLLAYKALSSSASMPLKFDINKAIVIPDFEFEIKDVEHEHINSKYQIIPTKGSMVNPVMDGCGICLPSFSKKNMQFRAPWMKGLLTPFNFVEFAKENEVDLNTFTIKDAWGESRSLKGIEVIFTESQLKMRKYFANWDEYVKAFEEYNCEFSIVCDESLENEDFTDKPLNYQMIQTLYKAKDKEVKYFASYTKKIIEGATESNKSMLEFVGATKGNKYKLPYHEALMLDENLLSDSYTKAMIGNKKANAIRDARAGKILIPNTKRMFIIPDIVAVGQWMFGKTVTGALDKNEVSCSLYNNEDELNVLRSPHLFIEHAVRTNVVNSKTKWFTTKGIYTSIHDTISHQLAFDVDGDEALVVSDKVFIECAKRHMKGILPLAYEMKTGELQEITNINIYNSLTAAFKVNIGDTSNQITKIFNKDEVSEDDIKLVKQLKYYNNQQIDYAKTLWLAPMSTELKKSVNKIKNDKVPKFFMYAKNKTTNQVEDDNNSTVNRLYEQFKVGNLKYNTDQFDYQQLMKYKDIQLNKEIINKYKELLSKNTATLKRQIKKQGDNPLQVSVISYIRNEMLKLADIDIVVDVLVKYLYINDNKRKQILWDAFGDVMLFNLKRSKGKLHKCKCGVEYEKKSNRQIQCDKCKVKSDREKAKLRKQKQRNKIA